MATPGKAAPCSSATRPAISAVPCWASAQPAGVPSKSPRATTTMLLRIRSPPPKVSDRMRANCVGRVRSALMWGEYATDALRGCSLGSIRRDPFGCQPSSLAVPPGTACASSQGGGLAHGYSSFVAGLGHPGSARNGRPWTGRRRSRPDQPLSSMRFQAMDLNRDGRIAREEWVGSDRSFVNHDWNGDGVLSGDEVRAGAQRSTGGTRPITSRTAPSATSAGPRRVPQSGPQPRRPAHQRTSGTTISRRSAASIGIATTR